MKTLTVRLPDSPIKQIEIEARRRKLSKSDVVRERLARVTVPRSQRLVSVDSVADIIGSVDCQEIQACERRRI